MATVTLDDALAALDAAGGRLSAVNGSIRVDVEQELPEAVWEALARHKADLLNRLVTVPAPPAPRPLPLPAGIACCDRCASTETTDSVIHGGESIRRDCRRCGRFRAFVKWHGVTMP